MAENLVAWYYPSDTYKTFLVYLTGMGTGGSVIFLLTSLINNLDPIPGLDLRPERKEVGQHGNHSHRAHAVEQR